jgi:hypothetical protein
LQPPIGSSRSRIFGSSARALPSSTRAQILDPEEVDDVLDAAPVGHLFPLGQTPVHEGGEDPGLHTHVAAEHEIVEHGHAAEQGDVLEGPRDAQLGHPARRTVGDVAAFEGDATRVGVVEAADHVEQSGLAGAVRADDRQDLAATDVQAHPAHCLDAAE